MFSAVGLSALAPVQAKTIAWYHFDEHQAGVVSSEKETILNAADPTVASAVPYSIWQNTAAFSGRDGAPVYAVGFPDGVVCYDPVSGTRFVNSTSLEMHNTANNIASGHHADVFVRDASALHLSTFTIEAFVRDTTTTKSQYERIFFFMEGYKSSSTVEVGQVGYVDGEWAWMVGMKPGGELMFNMSGKREGSAESGYTFPNRQSSNTRPPNNTWFNNNIPNILIDGQWHHIAMTVDGVAKKVRLYIDYVQCFEDKLYSDIPYESTYLHIGTKGCGQSGSWGGLMDEVRISDVVLQPDQMLRPVAEKSLSSMLYLSFTPWFGTKDSFVLNAAVNATVFSVARNLGTDASNPEPIYSGADLPSSVIRDGIADRATSSTNDSAVELVPRSGGNTTSVFSYNDVERRIMSDSFTAELFFKTDKPSQFAYGTYLLSETAGLADSWSVFYGTDARLKANVRTASGVSKSILTSTRYDDNNWHHIAYVWDKVAQVVRFYVDYKLIGTATEIDQVNNAAANTDFAPPFDRNLWIGGRFNGSAGQSFHFTGKMDELRITQMALDPQEFLTGLDSASPLLADIRFDNDAKMQPYGEMLADGVLFGAVSYVTKVPCKSLVALDGAVYAAENPAALSLAGGSVTFRRNLLLETADEYTLEFFLRTDPLSGSLAQVLRLGDARDCVWSVAVDQLCSSLVLEAATDTKSAQTIVFTPNAGMGWHHYALTFGHTDLNTEVKLFLNGSLVGTKTLEGHLNPAVGASELTVGSAAFCGKIDEIRMTEGVLDASKFLACDPVRGLKLILH